ncbi:LAFE_0D03818g1_1 [Lachancea fermentati]|uniref:LAFE_0D03818g1_1 n=1 Tax=Lachancea fermentati TaxID=4955 RepID=A0A1G4MBB9_LACFM|nr:LAFE_0D03818g1_1 [Lachancea fermentati]
MQLAQLLSATFDTSAEEPPAPSTMTCCPPRDLCSVGVPGSGSVLDDSPSDSSLGSGSRYGSRPGSRADSNGSCGGALFAMSADAPGLFGGYGAARVSSVAGASAASAANAANPAGGAPPARAPTPARARNFWSLQEDELLLHTVINERRLLLQTRKSKPRSRFWRHISSILHVQHCIGRNKRQCRDRFNLLFWKALRNKHEKVGANAVLDSLLLQCQQLFYIDHDNNIMLRVEGARAATAGATPVTAAAAAAALAGLSGVSAGTGGASGAAGAAGARDQGTSLVTCLNVQLAFLARRVDELQRAVAAQKKRLEQLEHTAPDAVLPASSSRTLSGSSAADTDSPEPAALAYE